MVQHLTISDERFWFRAVFDSYRQEIELANAVIASTPLDAAPAMWPDELWPNWKLQDLRAVILHVITETACHAGHLDAVRELIDGRTWPGWCLSHCPFRQQSLRGSLTPSATLTRTYLMTGRGTGWPRPRCLDGR